MEGKDFVSLDELKEVHRESEKKTTCDNKVEWLKMKWSSERWAHAFLFSLL